MSSFTVSEGDTFEDISRKQFGSTDKTAAIIAANPGASNPPAPGTTLFVPKVSVPPAPKSATTGVVTLLVDGEKFIGWTDIEFSRSMDSFGAFNFRSVWEPDNAAFRSAFRPFEYQQISIFEGSELVFNGTMIGVMPSVNAKERTVAAAGYSLPGVLNDCTPPVSALPLEQDEQDLQQIAKALLAPFGLGLTFEGDPGPIFDREAMEPTDRIYNYLIKLAKQRNLIITDTPEGACKFHTEIPPGSPVAVFKQDDPGKLNVVPQFGNQEYYSHVSGLSATTYAPVDAEAGGVYTVVNPKLSGVLRPFTFKPADTQTGDNKLAVEAKSGRMFASSVSYSFTIPAWRDPGGNLWKPNTTILLQDNGAMIYSLYEFLIREVSYRRTADQEIATLTLTLPGVFSGKIPEKLPWEE